jgi:hypothetical protein
MMARAPPKQQGAQLDIQRMQLDIERNIWMQFIVEWFFIFCVREQKTRGALTL